MNRKLLVLALMVTVAGGTNAQKNQQRTTAYAITGTEKGSQRWTEVRLIDVHTGEVIQTIYENSKETPAFSARSGKPIVKKSEPNMEQTEGRRIVRSLTDAHGRKVTVIKGDNNEMLTIIRSGNDSNTPDEVRKIVHIRTNGAIDKDKPFATKSAACAYDKKHDRLYYTPMGINQLRYIDLKSKETKVFYFDEDNFGVVAGMHDVKNQITRMAIASDHNGYALTNDAQHLIKFTTNKKAVITDLGPLKDDAENGNNSIHAYKLFGGDMVADDKENLYLVAANKSVFKISINDMTAKYLGSVSGLPVGFTTNGAAVEKESTIIISSANNTLGYYKFDLKDLVAEKISQSDDVYNASDLANGNLLSDKKKKDETSATAKGADEAGKQSRMTPESDVRYKASVYPNPVVKGEFVYVRFNDFPAGRYHLQLFDMSGKLLSTESLNVGSKMQLHLLQIPKSATQGQYSIKITGDANAEKILATEQIMVQ